MLVQAACVLVQAARNSVRRYEDDKNPIKLTLAKGMRRNDAVFAKHQDKRGVDGL